MVLSSATSALRILTSAAVPLDVHVSYIERAGSDTKPGGENKAIATATTTVALAGSANGERTIRLLTARNRHATTANDVTVVQYDGTVAAEVFRATLAAGECLHYAAGVFQVLTAAGRPKMDTSAQIATAAVNAVNLVVLAADAVNNGLANVPADAGLSFPVVAGEQYWFCFTVQFTANATTSGTRWSITGPASPTQLRYRSAYSLTATSRTFNEGLSAYDQPATANATSATTGSNVAVVEGFIQPSANGTVMLRSAPEVSASAITAKAGSLLRWVRVA